MYIVSGGDKKYTTTHKTLSRAKKQAKRNANRLGYAIAIYKAKVTKTGNMSGASWFAEVEPDRKNNPSILAKLKRGIRGHIKLSRGRLIIKT